jgi:hypothetical protein
MGISFTTKDWHVPLVFERLWRRTSSYARRYGRGIILMRLRRLVPAADCLHTRDLSAAIDKATDVAMKGQFIKIVLAIWSLAMAFIMLLVGDLLDAAGVSPRAWWWRRCAEVLLYLITVIGAAVYAIAREARSVLHQRLPTVICQCGYYLNNMVARCPECGAPVRGAASPADQPGSAGAE